MASAAPGVAPRWRVERAGSDDAAAIVALGVGALARGWTRAALEAELSRPEASLWVARAAAPDAAPPVGFLLTRLGAGELQVLLLAVAADARRRGAGSAMLEVALGAARRAGARVVHLEVRAPNRVAQRFYLRHGFEAVGRRHRYYTGGEDAVLMSRELV